VVGRVAFPSSWQGKTVRRRLALLAAAATAGCEVRAAAREPPPRAAAVDASIVPADRRTIWSPGIPSDDLLGGPLTADGLPERTAICATADAAKYGDDATDATAHIQQLLDACRSGQVVYLPPGLYRTSGTLRVHSAVVVRGAGPARTKILRHPDAGYPNRVIWMGEEVWGWERGTVVDVIGGVRKGSRTIVVSHAAAFSAGDFIHIDQIDDPAYMVPVDPQGSRTHDHPWRTLRTLAEIVSVHGNQLTLKDPAHHTFVASQKPQVVRLTGFTKWAGVEDLYVTGSDGRGGSVGMSKCAYCWIKNVESNGRFVPGDRINAGTTIHFAVSMSYRAVIRDSYVHDSRSYGHSGDSYGIVLLDATTNSLVENCISVWMNKPIQFQFSGGGNVIGYSYADNALDTNSLDAKGNAFWMENAIEQHCQFPHHELVEGCYASQIGPDATHGGSGWLTFFRNHATAKSRGGTTIGAHAPVAFPDQYGNVVALFVGERNYYATSIGNVLLIPGALRWPKAYEESTDFPPTGDRAFAYRLGWGAAPDRRVAQTFHRHLDFDYATNRVYDNPANPVKKLPDSLYLTAKPAFFGSNPWPWVDPEAATPAERVKTLPAKARYDAEAAKF